MTGLRIKELLALMMIGDGVTTMFQPRRHVLLWRMGPKSFKKMIDTLARHPGPTRLLGLLGATIGLWWASKLFPHRRRMNYSKKELFLW